MSYTQDLPATDHADFQKLVNIYITLPLVRLWHFVYMYYIASTQLVREILIRFTGRLKVQTEFPQLSDRVVVITGGGRGIGLQVVKRLLECDMQVILGCRDVDEARTNVDKVHKEIPSQRGTFQVLHLDLASLESVRHFAQQIVQKDVPIHCLVNNGGVMFKMYTTDDGLDSQVQINHLSHALLTHLLMPQLRKAGQPSQCARIVNLSSAAHFGLKLYPDFSQLTELNCSMSWYAHSKLLQVMFSMALDKKLEQHDTHVRSYVLHPGVVNTGLYSSVWWAVNIPSLADLFLMTPQLGGDTVMYAIISPEMESFPRGVYMENSSVTLPSSDALDPQKRDLVYRYTLDTLNINDFGNPLK